MDTQEILHGEAIPVGPTDFCALFLDPLETVIVYGALRAYSQALMDNDQLSTLSSVLEIMQNLQPMAQRASQYFHPSQTVAPD